MARPGGVTFKGTPLTFAGEAVKVGQPAPDFTLHRFADGGLKTVTLADVKGKPTIISVVPSLDTPVCQIQTKKFNEQLAGFGDKINALTVSLDLPFAMNRFCGAEKITNSDFGQRLPDPQLRREVGHADRRVEDPGPWHIRPRFERQGRICRDGEGSRQEPNYDGALSALKSLVH